MIESSLQGVAQKHCDVCAFWQRLPLQREIGVCMYAPPNMFVSPQGQVAPLRPHTQATDFCASLSTTR